MENIALKNGTFRQTISISIKSENHQDCLYLSRFIKKQCEAWSFSVKYDEYKSARKGDVLRRNFNIYQIAKSNDILIFKESIRIISTRLNTVISSSVVEFWDRGVIPMENNYVANS